MTGIKIELVLELLIVMGAPILYQYYLWKRGRANKAQLVKAAKLFAPLYLMLFIAIAVLWLR